MARKRLPMRKLREILRLKLDLGASVREIAQSCNLARSTASDYVGRIAAARLSWPLPPELDDDECLHDDPAGHLALADTTVAERDRDLADPGAQPAGTERHLDLEHVAPGVHPVERDGRQRRGPPRLEPAGQVMWGETQHGPGEQRAAA